MKAAAWIKGSGQVAAGTLDLKIARVPSPTVHRDGGRMPVPERLGRILARRHGASRPRFARAEGPTR